MDPLKNQQLAKATVDVFLAIEEQILINMAKHLKRHGSLFVADEIQAWQTLQLQELGGLTQSNIATIAKHSGLAATEVKKMLETVGYETVKTVDEGLKGAVNSGKIIRLPTTPSTAMTNILKAYESQALNTFNLINSTMLQQSQRAYIDILSQTTGKVLSGAITPQQALRQAASLWAEKGIPSLIDGAGRKWSTEAYVNMVTRTTSNNVANEMQFGRMEEHGIDLVEVSSHLGARERCAPFQGQIYSKSGTDDKYPPLSSTSYGEIAGLRGINCGHVFYPFIEGVSIQRFKPYNSEQNDRAYKQSQQQRYLERRIRHAKREMSMFEELGDREGVQIAKDKIKERQADIREFIKGSGRTRRRDREQIV